IGGGCPFQASTADGGFSSFAERIDANKVRQRSPSFHDHFSQATLFYNSQSPAEKRHLVNALRFELGKVEIPEIRTRMLGILSQVDKDLASQVAEGLGIPVPAKPEQPINHSFGADTDPKSVQPKKVKLSLETSAALSMANTVKDTIKSRKIAALIADGFDGKHLESMKKALMAEGATLKTVAPRLGVIKTADGKAVVADFSLLTAASVLFDAVYIPPGPASVETLSANADACHFVDEAYKHCKAICSTGDTTSFLDSTYVGDAEDDDAAVILAGNPAKAAALFITAIANHRNWDREAARKVPA
ncbi:MAG: catalase-related domain-containing protein, partial [Acidobacteriota bacterium]